MEHIKDLMVLFKDIKNSVLDLNIGDTISVLALLGQFKIVLKAWNLKNAPRKNRVNVRISY